MNKQMKEVQLTTCESGNWEVLIVDNKKYYAGHSIPNYIWLKLLNEIGCVAFHREITDEEMECM